MKKGLRLARRSENQEPYLADAAPLISEPMISERLARELLERKDEQIESLKKSNARLRESLRELLFFYRGAAGATQAEADEATRCQ
jgi:hypothetical protein